MTSSTNTFLGRREGVRRRGRRGNILIGTKFILCGQNSNNLEREREKEREKEIEKEGERWRERERGRDRTK